jgi:hypothetical protein
LGFLRCGSSVAARVLSSDVTGGWQAAFLKAS